MNVIVTILMIGQFGQHTVDQPNTRTLGHGEYGATLRFGPSGGVLGYFGVGVLDRFSFGLSLGGANVLGSEDLELYNPGVQIKVQVLTGGLLAPEWALGFDNQGFGSRGGGRYMIKSKGFYSTVGKGFGFGGGEFYIYGGLNYTLEDDDRSSLDIFFGQELSVMEQFSLLAEYNPALNDPRAGSGGFLNAALRIRLAEPVVIEFALRDILSNSQEELNRLIKVGYQGSF